MPKAEIEELTLIYQTNGMSPANARDLAQEMMKDTVKALEEKLSGKLRIGHEKISPFKEAWLTGVATAIVAFIPVFPFLIFKR